MKRMVYIVVIYSALYGTAFAKKVAPQAPSTQHACTTPFEKTPGSLTPQQLLTTIQQDLRDPQYPEILGNSFYHLMQLLDYAGRTDQPRIFVESNISCFTKFLKRSPYVNAYAFSDLLAHMSPLLKKYFITPVIFGATKLQLDIDMIDRFQQTINALMVSQFTAEWNSFKEHPQTFLDQLSQQIANAAQEEVSIFQLRQALIKFLEVGLSKLVWNPNDEMRTWQETKNIIEKLANLREINVLDDINELDELYWTITSRFCFFMETMSTDLPLSFYQKIKRDLATSPQLLGEIEEQEPFMESKLDYLKRIIVTSETKKIAFEQAGIISS